MPALTRDFVNPILKHMPVSVRKPGFPGGLLISLVAAVNPMSWFTKPYIGAIIWIVVFWWVWNRNPFGLITPKGKEKQPGWWKTMKTFFLSAFYTPIPLFFIYALILSVARFDAKITA
jgi:hypothetical protein